MREVYVMVPLVTIDDQISMENEIQKLIKLNRSQFSVYEMEDNIYTVHIDNFNLTFNEINKIIEDKIETQRKIKILENVLQNYQATAFQTSLQSSNFENLVKKAKKYKQIKEQNKKLRKLLQIQLENTEKVRQQTQKTMKTLKQQFDALVIEMNKNHQQKNQSNINSRLNH